MPVDPKLLEDARFHAGRLAQDPRVDHEVRLLAREVVPALLAEIERLDLECRAKDALVEVGRQEIERLRGGPGRLEARPDRRPFVPPTGACPNCTLEWWEHDEEEQRACRELLTGG